MIDNSLRRYDGDAVDRRRVQYLGSRYGQREETRERYRDAIEACASVMYLGKTLAAIARLYGHQPEAFRMMMKRHYPDILAERERMRHVMGLRRTVPQDVRSRTETKYAPAIKLLRKRPELPIRTVAEMTGLPYLSLEQHILFHHKDLAAERLRQRMEQLGQPRQPGRQTASGRISSPRGGVDEYYAEAVRLYRERPEMTIREIAEQCGHTLHSLGCYLRRWHRDVMQQRQQLQRQRVAQRQEERARHNADTTKAAKARRKYAPALALLEAGKDYDEAARQTGVDREQLLSWVKHNRPDVHQMVMQTRWVTLPGGVRMSREKWEAYQQAAQEWRQSKEPLKHVAERHGLRDVRLREFLRRIGETV